MKPLKIFIAPETESAIEITEAKHAIKTLADIAGLPINFFSNSKKGPFDLAYSNSPSQIDCRIFIPIAANKTKYDLTPTKLVEGKVSYLLGIEYMILSGYSLRAASDLLAPVFSSFITRLQTKTLLFETTESFQSSP